MSAFEMQNLFDEHYEYFDRDARVLQQVRKSLESHGGGLLVQGTPSAGNITTLFVPAQPTEGDKTVAGYHMVPFETEAPQE